MPRDGVKLLKLNVCTTRISVDGTLDELPRPGTDGGGRLTAQAWHIGTQAGGGTREGLISESQAGEKYDSIFLALCCVTERTLLLPPPPYSL